MSRLLLLAPLLVTPLTAQRPPRPAAAPAPAVAPGYVMPAPAVAPSMWAPALAAPVALASPASVDLLYSVSLPDVPVAPSFESFSYNFNNAYNYAFDSRVAAPAAWSELPASFASVAPAGRWQSDPADSAYRAARDQLNRGDYRRAATLFRDLPQKFPNSAYASDAMYWQAFALYRIGGTAELQEALGILETQKTKYPGARGTRTASSVTEYTSVSSANAARPLSDADALAARIAGVLSTRGLSNDAAVRRALTTAGDACDQEEQSVRAEALNALMQTDAEAARTLALRILGRRDDCSVALRRSAIFLVGNKRDDAAATALIPVAKGDPSLSLRVEAINWLAKLPGEPALATLEDLARNSDEERIQRAAVSALTTHPNARARTGIRALIERNDASEAMRVAALDAFNSERATAEDATWLRGIYSRTTSPRVRQQIAYTLGRIGGEANDQWLLALSRNEDEPIEARTSALRRAGQNMDIATLGRFYDATSQRQIRETVISILANRKESEAVDKLMDIARNGTDPNMRRSAISVLARSKDPRAQKLLLELIDK